MYLLQLDTGRTLDTDAAHVMAAEAAAGGSQGQPTGEWLAGHAWLILLLDGM